METKPRVYETLRPDAKIVAGIDDATKCPCIGSIFISGVVADIDTVRRWQEMGVKDSKLLTRKKRDTLEKVIKETALAFEVDHIPPAHIDDKSCNLNEWEMIYCLRIIKRIYLDTLGEVFIDNWEVSEPLFHARMEDVLRKRKVMKVRRKLQSLKIVAEHQADEKYTVVGAASILSKVASDRQYDRYRKRYGDFGSGSPGDPQTRMFVWEHRRSPLPIIRQSWKTYKQLSQLEKIEDDPLCRNKLLKLRRRAEQKASSG